MQARLHTSAGSNEAMSATSASISSKPSIPGRRAISSAVSLCSPRLLSMPRTDAAPSRAVTIA